MGGVTYKTINMGFVTGFSMSFSTRYYAEPPSRISVCGTIKSHTIKGEVMLFAETYLVANR